MVTQNWKKIYISIYRKINNCVIPIKWRIINKKRVTTYVCNDVDKSHKRVHTARFHLYDIQIQLKQKCDKNKIVVVGASWEGEAYWKGVQ